MKSNLPHHEDDSVAEMIHHFGSRLFLVFSSFFFLDEFKKDKEFINKFSKEPYPDIRGFSLAIIQTACLNSTLLAIRDLDDFFKPRTRDSRDDVLKASDLEYQVSLEFLTQSERKRISKIIMHSTVTAVENQAAEWTFKNLLQNALLKAFTF